MAITLYSPHPAAPQMKYGGNRLNRNEMRKKKQDFFVRIFLDRDVKSDLARASLSTTNHL